MPLREATQNRILQVGAARQGHDIPLREAIRGDPTTACSRCGKLFIDICEDAMKDVEENRPIARCTNESTKP